MEACRQAGPEIFSHNIRSGKGLLRLSIDDQFRDRRHRSLEGKAYGNALVRTVKPHQIDFDAALAVDENVDSFASAIMKAVAIAGKAFAYSTDVHS